MIAATQSNHPLAAVGAMASQSPVVVGCSRLKERGLRITKPRVALIEALARQSGPVSIDKLHDEVSREACDLVTVYRCLGAFEDIGLVRRSFLHNGTSLYELTLGATPQHYHLVCKNCGKTERVDYFPIEGVERLLRERGYTGISHLVEFFGVCPTCQAAAPARSTTPGAR
jgi:Fur family ferric uptake transcriptional regulator